MQDINIQAVVGAIRATEGIEKSRRFESGARSCGVYAEKWGKDIIIGYWTAGYRHHQDRAESDLALAIETLKARGFNVIERESGRGIYARNYRAVIAA